MLAEQVLAEPIEKRAPLRKRDMLRSFTPETIPWLVTGMIAVALSAWCHSLLPAAIMGVVDLVFWGYVTLKAQARHTHIRAARSRCNRRGSPATHPPAKHPTDADFRHHTNPSSSQDLNRLSPPEPSSRSLDALYDSCLRYSPGGAEKFIRGWFFEAPLDAITRDDMLEWLSWASYTRSLNLTRPNLI